MLTVNANRFGPGAASGHSPTVRRTRAARRWPEGSWRRCSGRASREAWGDWRRSSSRLRNTSSCPANTETDPGNPALRCTGLRSEGFEQVIDRAGGHAVDASLCGHRLEGLVVETWPALARAGEGWGWRIAGLRGHRLVPVPVAPVGAGAGVFRPTLPRSVRWPRLRSASSSRRPATSRTTHGFQPNGMTHADEAYRAGTRRTACSQGSIQWQPMPGARSLEHPPVFQYLLQDP